MSGPLATLFDQFHERVLPQGRYTKFTKPRLQTFVVHLRDRGLKPRSVNTYLQALNAFTRWLHEEHGHSPAHLPLLKTEKRDSPSFPRSRSNS